MTEFLVALVPSAGIVLLFVIVLRALLHADRRERAASARFESHRGATDDDRQEQGRTPPDPGGSSG